LLAAIAEGCAMKTLHKVVCADGYEISTTHFAPEAAQAKAQILMAGATAVPQEFYERFAKHATTRGYAVRTLDYRGIGQSAPKRLRGFRMNYLDWGRQDLAATLEHMQTVAPTLPTFMVGHSYGGHGFGLMPNHRAIRAFYTFASGAGWHGHMPVPERYKVWALWNVLGPPLVAAFGYLPGQVIGGEDLPIDVYRQWRHWCRHPHYFFDDPAMAPALSHFAEVRTPIKAATSIDDLWAPPVSRDFFFKGYRNTSVTPVDLNPADLNLKSLGHMGYFRKSAQPLWDTALDWFDESCA
jgi:predicted alpha/beta hydrolase